MNLSVENRKNVGKDGIFDAIEIDGAGGGGGGWRGRRNG